MANPPPAPSIEILLAHSGWVRALAHELVADPAIADDVVQETWLQAISRPPRTITSARGWLATVVRNVVRDRARSESRRSRREQLAAREEAVTGSDSLVAEAEMGRELTASVLAMDEMYRTVLLQRFWKGMEPSEIARSQGIPVATVKTRLARGLEKLRSRLDESHGGDRQSWLSAVLPFAQGGTSGAQANTGTLHASPVSPTALAAIAGLTVVAGLVAVARWLPNKTDGVSPLVMEAGSGFAQRGDSKPGPERALTAGTRGSEREPIAALDGSLSAGGPGTPAQHEELAPAVVLGEGRFDPLSEGPRAIALEAEGSLFAFEYGSKGRCLAFDRAGVIRASLDGVGYCSEAVRVGSSIVLTAPEGRLVKFDTLALKKVAEKPVLDKGDSWLCNALCIADGIIHVASGNEGQVFMFDANLEPRGSWGPCEMVWAMDASGGRIFIGGTRPKHFIIRALQAHGIDAPTALGDELSIEGVFVDLCAVDEHRVLLVKDDGQVLQYRSDPDQPPDKQWSLQGQTNLANEEWAAPANGLSRIAYDPNHEMLYLSYREPRGRIVAVPYSAVNARRSVIR